MERMSLSLILDQGKFLLTGLSSTNWEACILNESKMIISDRNIQRTIYDLNKNVPGDRKLKFDWLDFINRA